MKEDLLLQVSLFGDFSIIDLSNDTMIKLLQTLGEYKLVPMNFRELNINTQQFVMRPQFTTQDGSFIINFGTTRIDIFANNVQNFGIIPIDEFYDITIKCVNDIFDSFKLISNRLSFISKSMFPIIDSSKECYKKNNLSIEFYEGKDNSEWSIRNLAKVKVNLKEKDTEEVINVGTIISRMNVAKNNYGTLENIDAILIDTDINTLGENFSPRFSKLVIPDFLKQTIDMRNQIINQAEGVYNE